MSNTDRFFEYKVSVVDRVNYPDYEGRFDLEIRHHGVEGAIGEIVSFGDQDIDSLTELERIIGEAITDDIHVRNWKK